MSETSYRNPNPRPPADSGEAASRALAAVQVALDRRDNGGDADAARDSAAARDRAVLAKSA
jgi:hypothetical protein